MKKIICLILTVLMLLTVMQGTVVSALADTVTISGNANVTLNANYEVYLEENYSGTITIGSGANSIKISLADDVNPAEYVGTTGTCLVVSGGRTDALELTIEDFRITAPNGSPGIDFSSAGNYEHKLFISGTCMVAGSDDKAGIRVPNGVKLTIDKMLGLTDAAAQLTATGGRFAAGIGGNKSESSGTINISGGAITASSLEQGAGIGGGVEGSGGTTNISGGIVTATGGTFGAGIGGGWVGTGGVINISGGTVIANGSYGAAGIGGGRESYGNLPGEGDGGLINISDGLVTAAGLVGAGIGGGWGGSAGIISISGGTVHASSSGAGIGNGYEGTGGLINISGGTIEATGGRAGIGGGGAGTVGTINITGAAITATGGGGSAGIGGGGGESGGTINIGGGIVSVTGGTYAAGIGGGQNGASGNISISGGTVTVTGGVQGAGIGGGADGAGENISITGGIVTAVTAFGGAGIGGGIGNDEGSNDGGNITISGGTVTATCGRSGAGIGGGHNAGGGNITINGGTVVATSGTGTYETKGGAGIGGGYNGSGGTITINAGTVTARGAMEGAGIGGGSMGTGGSIIINDGMIEAYGGANGAGIGGGWSRAGGTITLGGGTIEATGGHRAAGIGGGSDGEGGTVTIMNTPIVIAEGDAEDGAEHIGRGEGWGDLNSGTLKDGFGSDLSYLRFSAADAAGDKLANVKIRIKGDDAEYLTNAQGLFWSFVPYTQSSAYSYTLSKLGYAAVRVQGLYSSVSHDFSTEMIQDHTLPVIAAVNALTPEIADVTCNEYGVFGSLYMVPTADVDYTSQAALAWMVGARSVYLESPQKTARIDAAGLKDGKYQFYAVDSAGNVSLPINIKLPFEIGHITSNYTVGIVTAIPVNELTGATGKTVEIKSELATVTLSSNMLTSEVVGNAKTVTLSIEAADIKKLPAEIQAQVGTRPVIQLSIKLDGRTISWNNPDAPVTVPYHIYLLPKN